MTRRKPGDDLELGLPQEDADGLAEVAGLLERERPVPTPAFRSRLRRKLTGTSAGGGARAARYATRRIAAAYLIAGTAFLAVAVLGLAGIGPFTAQAERSTAPPVAR